MSTIRGWAIRGSTDKGRFPSIDASTVFICTHNEPVLHPTGSVRLCALSWRQEPNIHEGLDKGRALIWCDFESEMFQKLTGVSLEHGEVRKVVIEVHGSGFTMSIDSSGHQARRTNWQREMSSVQ